MNTQNVQNGILNDLIDVMFRDWSESCLKRRV